MNTKNIILNAAFTLLEKKPIEVVSIQQIADAAQVSRKTVYNHFKDKYDLMRACFADYLDANVFSQFDGTNFRELQVRLLRYMIEHRQFLINIDSVEGQDSFWEYLRQRAFEILKHNCLRNAGTEALSEEEYLLILHIVEGGINVSREYVWGNLSMDVEALADMLYGLYPDKYKRHLD